MVIDGLDDVRECERLQAYWKTTNHATKVAVVVTLLNRGGSTHWVWRPQWMVTILAAFVKKGKPLADPVLTEAFANLTCVARADPADKRMQMTESFTPPGQTTAIKLPQFTSLTYFTLPYKTRGWSMDTEQKWIELKCVAFLEFIRHLLGKASFRIVMQDLRPDFTSKIYEDKRGTNNLPGFLTLAKTRTTPFLVGTDHVIKEVAEALTHTLYMSRINQTKYLPNMGIGLNLDGPKTRSEASNDGTYPHAGDTGDDDNPCDDTDGSDANPDYL